MTDAKENPAGNLPLLLYRIAERIALRHVPQEDWALASPFVRSCIERVVTEAQEQKRRRRSE